MIAFIGVRISWLMLARNMDFIWVASSALALACRSASSCCLRSVTSRMDTATCALSPACVESGLSPISTGNCEPSLRRARSSRPAPIERGAAQR